MLEATTSESSSSSDGQRSWDPAAKTASLPTDNGASEVTRGRIVLLSTGINTSADPETNPYIASLFSALPVHYEGLTDQTKGSVIMCNLEIGSRVNRACSLRFSDLNDGTIESEGVTSEESDQFHEAIHRIVENYFTELKDPTILSECPLVTCHATNECSFAYEYDSSNPSERENASKNFRRFLKSNNDDRKAARRKIVLSPRWGEIVTKAGKGH